MDIKKHPLKWVVEVSTVTDPKGKFKDYKILQIKDSKGSVMLVISDSSDLSYSYVEVSAKPVCELLVNALNLMYKTRWVKL